MFPASRERPILAFSIDLRSGRWTDVARKHCRCSWNSQVPSSSQEFSPHPRPGLRSFHPGHFEVHAASISPRFFGICRRDLQRDCSWLCGTLHDDEGFIVVGNRYRWFNIFVESVGLGLSRASFASAPRLPTVSLTNVSLVKRVLILWILRIESFPVSPVQRTLNVVTICRVQSFHDDLAGGCCGSCGTSSAS